MFVAHTHACARVWLRLLQRFCHAWSLRGLKHVQLPDLLVGQSSAVGAALHCSTPAGSGSAQHAKLDLVTKLVKYTMRLAQQLTPMQPVTIRETADSPTHTYTAHTAHTLPRKGGIQQLFFYTLQFLDCSHTTQPQSSPRKTIRACTGCQSGRGSNSRNNTLCCRQLSVADEW